MTEVSSCVAFSTVDALWQHEEVVAALAELADHLMPGHHCKHKPLDRSRILRIRLATNLDLKRTVQNREFREDLYFLLAPFPIESVPLRDRREDIPLAQNFVGRQSVANRRELTLSNDNSRPCSNMPGRAMSASFRTRSNGPPFCRDRAAWISTSRTHPHPARRSLDRPMRLERSSRKPRRASAAGTISAKPCSTAAPRSLGR